MMLFTVCFIYDSGSDTHVFTSREERDADLVDFVNSYWLEAMGTPPEDPQTRIERYFDESDTDDYRLGEVDVAGIMPVPSTEAERRCTDADALDQMAHLFSAAAWPGSSGLEDLCGIVQRTGRKVTDDPSIEWESH
jgi:hypothetical protein